MFISASALSPESQKRGHHVDNIVCGPLEHLPPAHTTLRPDVRFQLNLDLPNLSSFVDGERRKEEVRIRVDVLESGVVDPSVHLARA